MYNNLIIFYFTLFYTSVFYPGALAKISIVFSTIDKKLWGASGETRSPV